MQIVRLLISMFLVVLAVLSVCGFVWWGSPPEPLAGMANGGRLILGLGLVACLVGIWQLWSGGRGVGARK